MALTPQVGVIIACIANSEELTRRRTPKDLASSLLEVSAFFGAVPKTSLAHTLTGFDADMYNKMQVRALDRAGWQQQPEVEAANAAHLLAAEARLAHTVWHPMPAVVAAGTQ